MGDGREKPHESAQQMNAKHLRRAAEDIDRVIGIVRRARCGSRNGFTDRVRFDARGALADARGDALDEVI